MTNLDRLKGSPLLFDGLVSFVEHWAGELVATGRFDDVEPVTHEYPDLPDCLRQFYELRDRWPFLKLGDPHDFFAQPKVQKSGLIVFCELSSSNQLAVKQGESGWEFWNAYSGDGGLLADRELAYPLDQALVEMALGALVWYPWGVRPGEDNSDDHAHVRQLLDERSLVYSEDKGHSWAFWRDGTERFYWHPSGVLFQASESEIPPPGEEIENLNSLLFLEIGTCNLDIRNRLLGEGCAPKRIPLRGPTFTVDD